MSFIMCVTILLLGKSSIIGEISVCIILDGIRQIRTLILIQSVSKSGFLLYARKTFEIKVFYGYIDLTIHSESGLKAEQCVKENHIPISL